MNAAKFPRPSVDLTLTGKGRTRKTPIFRVSPFLYQKEKMKNEMIVARVRVRIFGHYEASQMLGNIVSVGAFLALYILQYSQTVEEEHRHHL